MIVLCVFYVYHQTCSSYQISALGTLVNTYSLSYSWDIYGIFVYLPTTMRTGCFLSVISYLAHPA